MSYSDEFHAAIERTARLGLTAPVAFQELPRKLLNDKRIRHMPKVLQPLFKEVKSYQELSGQCMSIHHEALPILEEWLQHPVYYTIGWVDDGTPRGLHRIDEATIEDKLANGHNEATINLHAWLTLPTMEVIDLALATTFAVVHNRPEGYGSVISKKADDLKGFSYKPMLVGSEFLERIGVLHNITVYQFD